MENIEKLIRPDPEARFADEKGAPYVVVPNDHTVKDLNHLMPNPHLTVQDVTFDEIESWLAYWSRFKTKDSVAFANLDSEGLHAVLDYHSTDSASHCKHTLHYNATRSLVFDVWFRNDKRRMSQREFATFIQENKDDIVKPDGSEILSVVHNLEIHRKVKFVSGVSMQDGTHELEYREEAEDGKLGKLAVPETFELGIPIYQGGQPYRVEAFLRYRIDDGELIFFYELHRLRLIVKDAFVEQMAQAQKLIGDQFYWGRNNNK